VTESELRQGDRLVESEGITMTPAAIARAKRMQEERGLTQVALRVFISGGGCSGLQYGMAFEPQPQRSDLRYSFEGLEVVVDPTSIGYLAGSSIDYIDDLMGGGFKIDNPNAVAACGCGQSFRTKDQAAAGAHAGCNC
jgi:iron-sulfur cluster assembly accessory protein